MSDYTPIRCSNWLTKLLGFVDSWKAILICNSVVDRAWYDEDGLCIFMNSEDIRFFIYLTIKNIHTTKIVIQGKNCCRPYTYKEYTFNTELTL